jgi:hypothetical protein
MKKNASFAVLSGLAMAAAAYSQAPNAVPGLRLWLDAQDGATINTSAGRITQWTDKSGNNNHATQGTIDRQPTYTGTINGFSAIRMNDGSTPALSDGMDIASSLNLTARPYTVFSIDSYWDAPFGGRTLQGVDANWLTGKWGCCGLGGRDGHFTGGWVGGDVNGGFPIGTGVVTLERAVDSPTSSRFYRNTILSGQNANLDNPGRLQIGYSGIGGGFDEPSRSDLGEYLVYNRVLTTTETRSVENYLASHWNLPRPHQNQFPTQTRLFTGGDPGEGLDFAGNFTYALTTNPGATGQVIGNASFTDITATGGVGHNSQNFISNWTSGNFGGSANDTALTSVTQSLRWSGAGNPHTTTLNNLVPGNIYKLQVMMNESCCNNRHFGMVIDGENVLRDMELGATLNGMLGVNPTAGMAVVHQFRATGTSMTLSLVSPSIGGGDANPTLSALTLENLGAATVSQGAITGVSSLDLSGSFLYALDFSNTGGAKTVGAVTFQPAESVSTVAIYAENFLAYNRPEFGSDPDSEALEDVLHTIRWVASDVTDESLEVDLQGIAPGQQYKLQLLFSDSNSLSRFFDISVENTLLANNYSVSSATAGDNTKGAYWTYTFTAEDSELNILLDGFRGGGGDINPILSGLTLELIPEPSSAALLSLLAVGMLRRRRTVRR